MDKQQIIEKAITLKKSGRYNCAQAVSCAFAGELGLNEESLYHTSNSFGVGMGGFQATCGAIIGAGIVIGLATGDRVKAMKLQSQLVNEFQARNGATACHKLKGIQLSPAGEVIGRSTPLRDCSLCVADAAEFAAEILANK